MIADSSGSLSSVAVVACYFGKLPGYASLVFHSIAANPSITWILITDQTPSFSLPPNVILEKTTLAELSERFSTALALPISIGHPYETCNLRPAFGVVFADFLKGYDYWGHVDLDMVYGDLRKFLPESILADHDRIYARGHLSLYRNSPEVNEAFKLNTPGVAGYREVFTDPRCLPQFDEWPGIWKIFRYHRFRQYHADVIADIVAPVGSKIIRFEAIELKNYPQQIFYWHQGKAYQAYYHWEGGLFDCEVAYVHFQKRKLPAPAFDPSQVNGFTIGPLGFAPYDRENLTIAEMEALNPTRSMSFEELRQLWSMRLRRKARKLRESFRPGNQH